jgi:hypothetical protein
MTCASTSGQTRTTRRIPSDQWPGGVMRAKSKKVRGSFFAAVQYIKSGVPGFSSIYKCKHYYANRQCVLGD